MLAAKQLAIGLGSVFLYCRRVVRALRELGLDVLTWGNDARHEEVSQYIHDNYGFPDCIGIVDGSLIRLTAAPKTMGLVYYCRKKYPAVRQLHNVTASSLYICCSSHFVHRSIFRQLLITPAALSHLIWGGQDQFQMCLSGSSHACGAVAVTTSQASNTFLLIKVLTASFGSASLVHADDSDGNT